MRKSFFTRLQIQEVLEQNNLNAEVTYLERELDNSPDNFIIYYRLNPNNSYYSDGTIHIKKVLVQVSHYHKKKLDSIEDLILNNFNVEPVAFALKQIDTDYFATHYRFEVFTKDRW